MTYITLMQTFMRLPHSELLYLKYAWIAWTIKHIDLFVRSLYLVSNAQCSKKALAGFISSYKTT